MPRAAVEVDDKDRRAESRRPPQQAQPRIAAKIIEDEPALPLFAELGDHLNCAHRIWRRSAGGKRHPPSSERAGGTSGPPRSMAEESRGLPRLIIPTSNRNRGDEFKRVDPVMERTSDPGFDAD